jgi:hypothetical protein
VNYVRTLRAPQRRVVDAGQMIAFRNRKDRRIEVVEGVELWEIKMTVKRLVILNIEKVRRVEKLREQQECFD